MTLVIATFENKKLSQARKAKNFHSLEDRGVLLSSFYGTTHPSLPNYLAQVGASHFGVHDDGVHDIDAETIFDRLEAGGHDWLSVQENYPTDYDGCMLDALYVPPTAENGLGYYARKHNPPMSFASVSGNVTRCKDHIISDIMFDRMLNSSETLPSYIYYTPGSFNFTLII